MKVIVTAGGTGGHIYPALGVVDKLMENKNNQVLYIGTTDRMESEIVPKLGIKYESIKISGLSKNIFKDIVNVKNIMCSLSKCKKIIKEFKPDYVIGFGGYVTFPVIYEAHKLGIKTAIHEQNMIPGKTNKYLSKLVDTTFVSFSESEKEFKGKVVLSGNPCGEKAMNTGAHDKTKLGFSKDKRLILIVMGSLGSETVNNKLREFLESFNSKDSEILFITGKSSYDNFKDLKVNTSIKIVPFYDNLSGLMKVSDLIISRAGASTISEILSLNIPSILIPSPYVANNHQYYNALDLEKKGVSIMINESDLNKEILSEKIDLILKEEKRIKATLKSLPKLKASSIIVEEMKK